MRAPTRPEACLLAALLAWPAVQAQSDRALPGKTLGDLIRESKRQQAQTLLGEPPKPVASPLKPRPAQEAVKGRPAQAPEIAKPPLLWSLVGADQKLVAEVIYEQRVLVVKLDEGDRQIGPWVIERYDTQGLHLSTSGPGNRPKKLWLAAPAPGASVAQFASALPDSSAKVQPFALSPAAAADGAKPLLPGPLAPPPIPLGRTP
jgi:hypothetical protein